MTVYAHINTCPNGSTGGIMMKEHKELLAKGEESYAFWGRGRDAQNEHEMKFSTDFEVKCDGVATRLDGKAGFHSVAATKRLLERLEQIKPQVVHLHNLHGYYLNVKLLFEWLAQHDCRVEWTLHDCWAFTGHCAYFTYVKCAQWKTHCAYSESCSQLKTYPRTFAGSASCKWNFAHKKHFFTLVPADRMKLITPSQWLADLVGESYLRDYPVEVRHNTIDTSIFKPTPSDFRERYGIGDRFMILGVASPWTERKGLSDFVHLANDLDSEKFAIVLVGLSGKQIKELQKQLVAIHKVDNPRELAGAYTTADVFVHPGVEETFGMTVAEAQACETHVIVTQGSACAEIADRDNTSVVPADLSTLKATIVKLAGGGLAVLVFRTESPQQLAAIYTAADIFFNPTIEDNYPTVNLEAEACGTTVVTYDTGGCKETVRRPTSIVTSDYDHCLPVLMELSK